VFDGRQSGSIETVAVRASDTRKGEAAAAEFREAVKARNERLMAAEENRTAAFPITVTLQYIGRTSGLDDGSTLGGDGSESDGGSDAPVATIRATRAEVPTAAGSPAATPRARAAGRRWR